MDRSKRINHALSIQSLTPDALPPGHAQVEISKSYGRAEWREDLKRLMRRAGADCKRTMFLFSDTQIKVSRWTARLAWFCHPLLHTLKFHQQQATTSTQTLLDTAMPWCYLPTSFRFACTG